MPITLSLRKSLDRARHPGHPFPHPPSLEACTLLVLPLGLEEGKDLGACDYMMAQGWTDGRLDLLMFVNVPIVSMRPSKFDHPKSASVIKNSRAKRPTPFKLHTIISVSAFKCQVFRRCISDHLVIHILAKLIFTAKVGLKVSIYPKAALAA